MSTTYNRIKVADLEKNQQDKILITNLNGELEFRDINRVKTESYNALDYSLEGKALDARQGKVLKDTIDTKQDIANQIEISNSGTVQNSWHGKTVLFTANCTITVPATLAQSFIFNGITLAGVSVTWAITAPHTWLFGTPAVTGEKQIFTFTKRGNTNSILLLGV
ncbi:hypothetical protein [Flavobacterium poyangense]|uniref:hypothetical protein n=1 Tax=Flavobacterium poyangense TaxID=2204302 RepID=UPI001423D663|nr:hypothetical protein [Flavobacterium sp. JXAS1]